MNNQVSTSSTIGGGVGFTGLLTITFIILKLTGVIAWPWIWVLSPIWISIILSIAVMVIFFFTAVAIAAKR